MLGENLQFFSHPKFFFYHKLTYFRHSVNFLNLFNDISLRHFGDNARVDTFFLSHFLHPSIIHKDLLIKKVVNLSDFISNRNYIYIYIYIYFYN